MPIVRLLGLNISCRASLAQPSSIRDPAMSLALNFMHSSSKKGLAKSTKGCSTSSGTSMITLFCERLRFANCPGVLRCPARFFDSLASSTVTAGQSVEDRYHHLSEMAPHAIRVQAQWRLSEPVPWALHRCYGCRSIRVEHNSGRVLPELTLRHPGYCASLQVHPPVR